MLGAVRVGPLNSIRANNKWTNTLCDVGHCWKCENAQQLYN